MNSEVKSVARSAVAGVIATVPMTGTFLLFNSLLEQGNRDRLPPREVTRGVSRETGVSDDIHPSTERKVSWLAHFGFGAAAGALYGLTPSWTSSSLLKGTVYGVGVYAASYLGWLPALGILPSAKDRSTSWNVTNLAAHVTWGAALGKMAETGEFRGHNT